MNIDFRRYKNTMKVFVCSDYFVWNIEVLTAMYCIPRPQYRTCIVIHQPYCNIQEIFNFTDEMFQKTRPHYIYTQCLLLERQQSLSL